MILRIVKTKKDFLIFLVKEDKSIIQESFRRLEDYMITDEIKRKIKKIEISDNLFITFKLEYPKINKRKILKMHKESFLNCFNNKYTETDIFKTTIYSYREKYNVCFYFMNHELSKFISNNKITKNIIKLLDDNYVFNKKYDSLLLINKFEISLWHNHFLRYHQTIINKLSLNFFISLVYTNNIKKLKVILYKELFNQFSSFIDELRNELEGLVEVYVEKI